jgi:hypothetical protein
VGSVDSVGNRVNAMSILRDVTERLEQKNS